jgi:formamidopyrimidine-DNA glycosylase
MLNAKKTTLKSALLNQKLIAGLGNIYVCEALWRSGLSPLRQASTLTRKNGTATARCHALAGHIREVIADAIKAGGSSLRDHMQTDGTLGYFQHSFAVYDQEGASCKKANCDGTIKRIVQSGRSTFYCSTCQR